MKYITIAASLWLLAVWGTISKGYERYSEANDCTADWQVDLSIDPAARKYHSGDTNAVYATYAYKPNRRSTLRFEIVDSGYPARFSSYESYVGRTQRPVDHLLDLDYQTQEDASMTVVWSTSPLAHRSELNWVQQPVGRHLARVHSLMFRLYAPDFEGGKFPFAALPRIYAFDEATGEPKACPQPHRFQQVDLPEWLVSVLRGAEERRSFFLEEAPGWTKLLGLGFNTAIPSYVQATNGLDREENITVLRFKSPSFGEANSQVRYWSFCFQDFAKNTTLACVPDEYGIMDQHGMVNIVFGKDDPVLRQTANERGYNFVVDRRQLDGAPRDTQKVVGFVYRNLLPEVTFAEQEMYQGDYQPQGVVCSIAAFLEDSRDCLP